MAAARRTACRSYAKTTPSCMRWQSLSAAHFKPMRSLLIMVILGRQTVLRGAYKLRLAARWAEFTPPQRYPHAVERRRLAA